MPADLQTNQDAHLSVYFEQDNRPVDGGSVDASVIDQRTGLEISAGMANELPPGSGVYVYIVPATQMIAGLARLRAVFKGFRGEVDLYHEAFYAVGATEESAQSRRSIRNSTISQIWGSHAVWKLEFATHIANSVTQGYVPMLSVGGDGEYRGRWLRFLDNSDAGLTRRVTAWNSQTKMLSWEPPLPSPALDGARVDLLPIDPDFFDQTLNDTITSLRPGVFDLAEEETIATDGVTTQFPLPDDAVAVYQVGLTYLNPTEPPTPMWCGWLLPGDWRTVAGGLLELLSPGTGPSGPLDQEVPPGMFAWPAGYRVRVRYLIDHGMPISDNDLVSIDPTYLRFTIGSALTMFSKEQERLTNYLAQQSELWRPRATQSRPPNCKAVIR